MLSDNILFWMYVVTVASTLTFYVARQLGKMFIADKYLLASKQLQLKINQAKGILQDLPIKQLEKGQGNVSNLLDLRGMSFDQACEMFGISKADRNNPIMRPMLEKIYMQMVAEMGGPDKESRLSEGH